MADFVTVMGIAKRYADAAVKGKHNATLDGWFGRVVRCTSSATAYDIEVAERELFAWDAAYPECPTLTDEQREVLAALWKLGFKWVCKDDACDAIFAYDEMPNRERHEWNGYTEFFSTVPLNKLLPLIPDWTQPLDIEKTLKEAGRCEYVRNVRRFSVGKRPVFAL